jgi:hypothetical protein
MSSTTRPPGPTPKSNFRTRRHRGASGPGSSRRGFRHCRDLQPAAGTSPSTTPRAGAEHRTTRPKCTADTGTQWHEPGRPRPAVASSSARIWPREPLVPAPPPPPPAIGTCRIAMTPPVVTCPLGRPTYRYCRPCPRCWPSPPPLHHGVLSLRRDRAPTHEAPSKHPALLPLRRDAPAAHRERVRLWRLSRVR